MRIGSIIYNTELHVNSAFAFKPGTLFVVKGQADNGGLLGLPLAKIETDADFATLEPATLDPGTFHRADSDLEEIVQAGNKLPELVPDFGKSLPNPAKKFVQQIEDAVSDLHENDEDEEYGEEEFEEDDED